MQGSRAGHQPALFVETEGHNQAMIAQRDISQSDVFSLLRSKRIQLAGNATLKIYGRLDCRAGKRMLPQNRVFFASHQEALEAGYRPCAVCLHEAYRAWKNAES